MSSHEFIKPSYLSNPYPNPTDNSTTLPFTLPDGENTGEIVLYNMQGNEIRRYKVDRSFSNIILNNSGLPSGNYYYQLVTSQGILGTKKVIVIK
jgi:hypothetical protein